MPPNEDLGTLNMEKQGQESAESILIAGMQQFEASTAGTCRF
jgi:hypothetical protein